VVLTLENRIERAISVFAEYAGFFVCGRWKCKPAPPIQRRQFAAQSYSMTTLSKQCASTIVIPARLASTRLPRKLLLCETGKTLIRHTYEAALRAARPSGVIVATDHEEIFREVESFGGRAMMTSPDCASGTDRVAEVARQLPEVDLLINVQGDEPEIAGSAIDLAVQLLEENPAAVMSTLATPIRSRSQFEDPACVKVVFDRQGKALYFSRSPIPHPRQWDDSLLTSDPPSFCQHVGLYAYRRDFLLRLAEMSPSRTEKIEKLEQLRVLEAGYSILVGVINDSTFGIDTPEDYRKFVDKWWRER
jgi:3-deoxy-manno-octulosonate cytidylyltransferase (CMP-KDO synthetase)